MELISGLMNNNQKSQSAEDIIPTLCDRIVHARLASDKRAAILAVKGFSREYRELVIANGLRGLISTLKDYTEDTDLLKATLETLLILFIRGEGDDDLTRSFISQQSRVQNGKYPSPLLLNETSSLDQFSLWIADEVTKDESNIATLVNQLENKDFYVRLYTLQFLEALVSTRAVKTKESILNTPLGVPKLVEVLGDVHDPVRNEAVLLLMAISNDNFSIQKLVAFENTFDRLFEVIHEEGDFRGSIVVQDCLTLISNLLKYNLSNQKLFIETNCLSKLGYLISEPLSEEIVIWNDQRLQNISIALDIVKLFVLEGNESTPANQEALYNADIFLFILRLSFSAQTPNSVRSSALLTVADLIANNPEMQQKFSSIDVPYVDPSLPVQLQNFKGTIPVVIALLNWCLFINSVHVFDIRVAACHLLEAYFHGNDDSRVAFIQDQMAEFKGEDNVDEEEQEEKVIVPPTPQPETNGDTKSAESKTPSLLPKVFKNPPRANIFTALLEYDPDIKLNPYKIWFSSVILIDAIHSNDEIKHIVTSLTSGDAESGEEIISAIQAISGLLVTTLNSQDPRISIGYLILLIDWLYEDPEAVNDFLGDSSTVRSLLTYLSQAFFKNSIIQGLVTILLGITFEFSSKNSPIPRVELHSLIIKMLGKNNYGFKILQLKENSAFADFNKDEIFDPKRDETGLPEVFFHPIIVQLIKENFYRIKNALNQDPNLEPSGRISYEKFDQLHSTYNELRISYEELKEKSSISQKEVQNLLDSALNDLTDITDKHESVVRELEDLKSTHDDLETNFKLASKELADLKALYDALDQSSTQQQKDLQSKSEEVSSRTREIAELKSDLEKVKVEKKKAEDGINKMSRELFQLTKAKEDLERNVKKLEKEAEKNLRRQEKLDHSLKQKTEEFQSLQIKLDSATRELKTVNDEKIGIAGQLKELSSKDQANSGLIEQMTGKLRSIATTCNELTSEKAQLEEKVATLQESHSREVSSLQSRIQELELSKKDLSQLSASLAADKEELSKLLESSKADASESYTKLQENFNKLKAEFGNIKAELEASKILAVKYEGQIKELSVTAKAQKSELKSLQDTHAKELESHKSEYYFKVEDIQRELAAQKESHSTEITLLNARLDEVTKLKESLSKELEGHKERFSGISKILSEKESLIKQQEDKSTALQNEVKELQELHKTLKEELSEKENQYSVKTSDLKATITELEQKIKDQEGELDDNAAEFEEKEAEAKKVIASLKDKLSSAEEEKKSLESSLEVISQSIETKGREYEGVTKDLKARSVEIEELKKSLEEAKMSAASSEESLELIKTQVKEVSKERDELKKKVDSLVHDVSKKETTICSLHEKIKRYKEKAIATQKELEDQIKDLNASIASKAEAFEQERSLLSENSDASTKEYSEKVTKLEEEMAKLEKKHSVRTGVLEKQKALLEEKIEELTNINGKLTDDLENKTDSAVLFETQAKELYEEMSKLRLDYQEAKKVAAKLADVEGSLSNVKQEAEALKKEIANKELSIKEAAKVHDVQLEKIKKELIDSKAEARELSFKSESSSAELNSKVKKLERSVKDLESQKASLTNKLEDATKSSTSTLEDSKKELLSKEREIMVIKKQVEQLKTELKTLRKENSDMEKSKNSESNDLSEKLKTLEARHTKLKESSTESAKMLETESQALKDENAKLLAELEKLRSELSASAKEKEEAQKVKAELKKLKGITVPKSELDDMMLVLADLDEKKSKYKQKAKDLGAEVSSDEEDDDEEDEEEEEEEEEEEDS